METYYTSTQAAKIYGVSLQTINYWAGQFKEYLSPTANPGGRRKRRLSIEDMRVLSLISSMKNEGSTFEDIHATLKTGQRGQAPAVDPNQVQAIVANETEVHLALRNERLQQMLVEAHDKLAQAQEQLKDMDKLRLKTARLEAQLDSQAKERERLENQVQALTEEIKSLSLQTGQEYAKGFQSGWQARNSPEND
nr:MerR family transcriptional regulator [Nitrosomonas nitrosa]